MTLFDRVIDVRHVPLGELAIDPSNPRTRRANLRAGARGIIADGKTFRPGAVARVAADGQLVVLDWHVREQSPAPKVAVILLNLIEAEAASINGTIDPLVYLIENNVPAPQPNRGLYHGHALWLAMAEVLQKAGLHDGQDPSSHELAILIDLFDSWAGPILRLAAAD